MRVMELSAQDRLDVVGWVGVSIMVLALCAGIGIVIWWFYWLAKDK